MDIINRNVLVLYPWSVGLAAIWHRVELQSPDLRTASTQIGIEPARRHQQQYGGFRFVIGGTPSSHPFFMAIFPSHFHFWGIPIDLPILGSLGGHPVVFYPVTLGRRDGDGTTATLLAGPGENTAVIFLGGRRLSPWIFSIRFHWSGALPMTNISGPMILINWPRSVNLVCSLLAVHLGLKMRIKPKIMMMSPGIFLDSW